LETYISYEVDRDINKIHPSRSLLDYDAV